MPFAASWLTMLLLLQSGSGAPPTPQISVTGSGSVFTPPDLAVVSWTVHGEGPTSDAALTQLNATRRAVDGGVRSLTDAVPKGGNVSIRAVRARECNDNDYDPPRLDTGACVIIGYVADLSLELRTEQVAKVGTITGLVGRLGARNPRVSSFLLADPRAAQRRAMAAALTDARTRAEAIAQGAQVRLGAILYASDSGDRDTPDEIMVTGSRLAAPAPPPPPPPPIDVAVAPRPIETQASARVTYQIIP
ncbi:SIMPL domain-containing protein [Sphingomonas sp. Mn802worker]|uniref:SIMPL domain-containing protein n=1 Tax=Sphingomonas sp. Mn802worker TaxID=629773 RepID=UPI0003761EBB|nr:SIMPL domain-containing protein [Sphingomonas sp. Mn802worker]